MTRTASSPIDTHAYLVHLVIDGVEAGAWKPLAGVAGSQRLLGQQVRMPAKIREIFKAPMGATAPTGLVLQVERRKPADGFPSQDYGPWSDLDLIAGLELLVFANAAVPGDGVDQVLSTGSDLLVRAADPQVPFALDDVRRALQWQAAHGRNVPTSDVVRQAIIDARSTIGPLLANFVFEGIVSRDLNQPAAATPHKLLLALLSAPETNLHFRRVALASEVNELSMIETVPDWFRSQLIRAMLNILGEDHATLLHEPIRQSYLLNAVFGAGQRPKIQSQDVLPSPAARQLASALLSRRQFSPDPLERLLRWLGI